MPCSTRSWSAAAAAAWWPDARWRLSARTPGLAVYSVEPSDFDDTARSLAKGARVGNAPDRRSFCDALLAAMPGELTFAINSRLLAGGLSVTDDEVARAMRLAFRHLRLVVEPGGAVALAAALAGRLPTRGENHRRRRLGRQRRRGAVRPGAG